MVLRGGAGREAPSGRASGLAAASLGEDQRKHAARAAGGHEVGPDALARLEGEGDVIEQRRVAERQADVLQ